MTLLSFRFKLIKIDGFDENGNITMDLLEFFHTLMKGYIITAKQKKLRTLKQIAAYNVLIVSILFYTNNPL